MVGLDNSASILPDYIDTAALEKEAATKRTELANARDAFSTGAVIAVTKQQTGAATLLQSYKNSMTNVTKWFTDQNTTMQRVLRSSSDSDYAMLFNEKKAEVEALRKKVEAERVLDGIRQEQTAALDNREEANFHSSWMGLIRPLKEESRTGLAVAAGAFAFVGILAIFYIVRDYMSPETSRSFFSGGFRSALKALARSR
jgi:hypothetical protein